MSAADNVSQGPKGQFGWIEDTYLSHVPAKDEFTASQDTGTTALTRADLSEERHAEGSGGSQHTYAPQEAKVTASWSKTGSRLYSDTDIETGRHWERNYQHYGSELAAPQGKLFEPGREYPPEVHFMESTERSRFATMGGLGALANLVEGYTGQTVKPSTDLSPHSAPLVSRMTGVEHGVTNQMDFVHPEDRDEVEVPSHDTIGEKSTQANFYPTESPSRQVTKTVRTVPDSEIDAGKKRLVGHMRSMKGPKVTPDPNTYTQGALFPEPKHPEYPF